MAVVSGLPLRADIAVIAGDAFSFSVNLNQNITGVSLTATMWYYANTVTGGNQDGPTYAQTVQPPRTLSHTVSNATTGIVSISLTPEDTNLGTTTDDNGCPSWWVLKSATKTYAAGSLSATAISGCSINTATSENAFL